MVWFEIEDNCGSDWVGISVDGMLNRSKLEECYDHLFQERSHKTKSLTDLFLMTSEKLMEDYERGVRQSGNKVGERHLYILDHSSFNKQRLKAPLDQLAREAKLESECPNRGYRQILLIHQNYSRDSLANTLRRVNFGNKSIATYQNFGRFAEATTAMIEQIVGAMISPANAAEELLRGQGLNLYQP